MLPRLNRVALIGAALFTLFSSAPAVAQLTLDFPVGEMVPYPLDSSVLDNGADAQAAVFEDTVQIEGAAWLRLYFNHTIELAEGSFIRITSLTDGEVQELDAAALARWGYSSAYFNGPAVLVELIAAAHSQRNRLVLDEIATEFTVEIPVGSCGICGDDDRVPSNDLAACRLLPAGCSAHVWHPESCIVSAGHCVGGNMVIQFNVPNSQPNCNLNQPPIADQFPIVQVDYENGGVGNDWSVMRSGTNNLGQLPYERYGHLRPITDSPPLTGEALTIYGYGIDSQCTLSQTQQMSVGNVTSVSTTYFNHNADATFGNSGSSIIRDEEILGIVTHCPCPNIATRVDHPDFAAAREAMCPPPEIATTSLPFFDPFPLLPLNLSLWTGIDGATTSTRGINEPSPQRSLNLDATFTGGDAIRTAIMDTTGLGDLVLSYWYEAGGTDDAPEVGDDLVVEYLNSSENWVQLAVHPGNGENMSTFEPVTIVLPPGAKHSNFRVQFHNTSDEGPGAQGDDWFVDNVCIGSSAFCAAPFECKNAGDCDDNVDCTDNLCIDGFCNYQSNSALCDDGLPCTDDVCNPVSGCTFTANDDNCDDGVDCTIDQCIGGICLFTPSDALCDDQLACTDDVCDENTGCEHIIVGECGEPSLYVEYKNLPVCHDTADPEIDAPLSVCSLYVAVNDPSDRVLSVGLADILTNDPQGFYQHPFGLDTAPFTFLMPDHPSLVCDSFVTIGVSGNNGTDASATDPDFDSAGFNDTGHMGYPSGWYNGNPTNGQGDGGNIIVGQFSVRPGFGVTGTLSVFVKIGSTNDITQTALAFECAATCPYDLDMDGTVGASDLALLLGGWGPNPGHPADFNGDGSVGAADLAFLLGNWGPCPA